MNLPTHFEVLESYVNWPWLGLSRPTVQYLLQHFIQVLQKHTCIPYLVYLDQNLHSATYNQGNPRLWRCLLHLSTKLSHCNKLLNPYAALCKFKILCVFDKQAHAANLSSSVAGQIRQFMSVGNSLEVHEGCTATNSSDSLRQLVLYMAAQLDTFFSLAEPYTSQTNCIFILKGWHLQFKVWSREFKRKNNSWALVHSRLLPSKYAFEWQEQTHSSSFRQICNAESLSEDWNIVGKTQNWQNCSKEFAVCL